MNMEATENIQKKEVRKPSGWRRAAFVAGICLVAWGL